MDSTHSPSLSETDQPRLTERKRSSMTSVSTQPKIEVPVWFSVFIGNPYPTAPRFRHARFDAKISKDMFAFHNNNLISSTDRGQEIFNLRAIVSLSLTFTDEMLHCIKESCIIYNSRPTESLELHRLMSTIASHTECIKRKDEINWSIGSFTSDRPYVCSLAMPICSAEGKCHRIATERAQKYIEGITDGVILPQPLGSKITTQSIEEKSDQPFESRTQSSDSVRPNQNVELIMASPEFSPPDSPLKEGLHNIGTTVFVGRPSFQMQQLTTAVFPDITSKTSFTVSNFGAQCVPMRKLIMKFCRFVNGTWKYSEMNAALGLDSDAHTFELGVPICETKGICEQFARVSAREFLKLLAPSGLSLPFPEPAQSLVEKIAPEFLIWGSQENNDHPAHCNLSVNNLRLWYEMCYLNHGVKRESCEEPGQHEEENQVEVGTEKSENDDSMVWVFDLAYHSHPLDENEEIMEAKNLDPVIAEYRNKEIFQPLLTLDFWLLYEAIGSRGIIEDTQISEGEGDYDDGYECANEREFEGELGSEYDDDDEGG
ncbi:hypothetical protein P170DRAFT_472394 [Aspergillus steynii IBT 23096]|uniref:Uncharacterized protein n=1 Tax=Aspergillus steynii IBT 23096 TaxID=1392250 RepID=A0A2I2GI12_9EURO|nr:uncharacterized protein P170DRAFT_472394 [Aspergillus steynii IBT 23096]PLB52504.1 hypothetical protein P170DRAFT_472394 [Aspergillus steynii IBT 23096]